MRQILIPFLLLATVAVSSSNVLPILANQLNKDTLDLNGQYNDNTFSNKYKTRDVLKEIYKLYMAQENKPAMDKLQIIYTDSNNNRDADILRMFNNNENYNGEGFRKEQWHNYPRQLDRLHQVYEENIGKGNYDTDLSKEQYSAEVASENPDINEVNTDLQLQRYVGTNNIYEAIIPANPLFILKIGLACLNKNLDNADIPYCNLISSEIESNSLVDSDSHGDMSDENPTESIIKVKREGISSTHNSESTDNPSIQNKPVNKRIFSLWSRLQSLNHKGHELQHRRHLHAFYGLPDSDGGGTLTAETRATLMRPPGSPLRWG